MLPVKIKDIELSSDGRLRMETFYNRFCSGVGGEKYGMGHLLFACYAAFPLLLSPVLANYLWLNFKSYQTNTGQKIIDRVAVSDFLLSPLVRQVARRQFEVLPEIRNYLLYLLLDGCWFADYGVITGKSETLQRLARFLESYTKDESSAIETNAESFRELNQWAALAYVSPGELTIRIGQQLASALAADDESRQLRLNVLMDRIGAQAALNPLQSMRKGKVAFRNLHSYSQGNRSRLFEESEKQISEWYYQLSDDFISKLRRPGQILLPVTHAAGNRLNRRKEGRQRIFPLFVYQDITPYHDTTNQALPRQQFEELLSRLSGKYALFELEPFRHLIIESLNDEFFSILEQIFTSANPEDLLLIYYMGRNGPFPKAQVPYKNGSISAAEFQNLIYPIQKNGCQIMLIMDAPGLYFGQWIKSGVQLFNQKTALDKNLSESTDVFLHLLVRLLEQTSGRITYEDLAAVLPFFEQFESGRSTLQPLLTADIRLKDRLVLTNQRLARHPDQYLILYENLEDSWRVIEEDFKMITRNSTTTLLTYEGKLVKDVRGEFFISDGMLTFGGMTKDLDNRQIYRALPEKKPLHIYVRTSGTDASHLYKSLRHIKRKGPMLWSSSPVMTKGRFNDNLLEVHAEDENEEKLTWQYFDQGEERVLNFKRKSNWTTPATFSPEIFLSKFSTFEFLMQLNYPDWFPERRKFDISFTGRWGTDSHSVRALDEDRLLVTEDSFQISGGELKLKTLHLEIIYHREWPLFCDVYILGHDLSVTKMTRQNLVCTSDSKIFELPNTNALERLLGQGTDCYFKILYSHKPILIDFSQEGLKDGSY